jgi:hypothetical protein
MPRSRQAQRGSRPGRKTAAARGRKPDATVGRKPAATPGGKPAATPGRAASVHRTTTRLMSVVMILIGLALLGRTVAAGGGGLAIGVVLGVLFVLAGAGRLYLQSRG